MQLNISQIWIMQSVLKDKQAQYTNALDNKLPHFEGANPTQLSNRIEQVDDILAKLVIAEKELNHD